MIINRIIGKSSLTTRLLLKFSGGGHHHQYDWRDDHAANPDFFEDPRMIGVKPYSEYEYPFEADHAVTWTYSHPDNYDQKNLHVNYFGKSDFGVITNTMEVPTSDYMGDIAHEFDYESEDLDYQAESFKSQHFRKKGPLWIWILLGTTPLWYFAGELFLQYWPEDDNWRYQRPPPLNYPDDAETPDTEYYQMFHSDAHRSFYEAGIANAPFFEIVDGKKVYTKWAGVNQPRDAI